MPYFVLRNQLVYGKFRLITPLKALSAAVGAPFYQPLPRRSVVRRSTRTGHPTASDNASFFGGMAEKAFASLYEPLQVNAVDTAATGSDEDSQRGDQQRSRKRTARACDSCYKRKVPIAFVGDTVDNTRGRLTCGPFFCADQMRCCCPAM